MTRQRARLHLTLAATLAVICQGMVAAAPSVPSGAASAVCDQAISKEIGAIETRYFSRQYINDPIEKRVERLELLFFGATQDGETPQRFARLKKLYAERTAESQKAGKAAAKEATAKPGKPADYPALTTLEWRALKKTFQGESLDQRLTRLEKKVFGAENPSIPYVDRVERLKRTLGIGAVAQQAQPAVPPVIGPAPKARPRGQRPDMYGYTMPMPGGRGDFFSDPNLGPGAGGATPLGLPSTISNMLKEMDRQMSQLEQFPSGNYSFDPNTGAWIEKNSGGKIKPPIGNGGALPGFKAPRIAPPTLQFGKPADSQLPPYSDPNSI